MSYTKTRTERLTFRREDTNWNGQLTVSRAESSLDCTRSGASVPNWRSRIKSGQAATSAFTGNYYNHRGARPARAQITRRQPAPGSPVFAEAIYGTSSVPIPAFGSLDTSLTDTQALTRIYANLRAQQTHASGMVSLGELRETIRMFKRPYSTAKAYIDTYLDKAFRHSRRYRWQDGSARHRERVKPALERALADSWLETAFGLNPLISDVKDLAEAVARITHDSRRVRITGSASNLVSGDDRFAVQGTATSYILIRKDELETMQHKVQYIAYLDWSRSADMGSVARLQGLFGFNLEEFVPTVYELMPWSFLVDYFSNLGTVIETGCASQSMIKFALKTTTFESTVVSLQTPYPSSASIPVVYSLISPGSVKQVRKRVLRAAYTQLPNVPFSVSLPGSRMQYANMLALWKSQMAGSFRVRGR